MFRQIKTNFRFVLSLFILSCCVNPLWAQQVKKPAAQKKPVTATPPKKTASTKAGTGTTATTTQASTKTNSAAVQTSPPLKKGPEKEPTIPPLKMTSRETQMVEEINLLRSDPAGYINYVKEFLDRSKASKRMVAAANELMNELKNTKPLNALKISLAMYLDARKYGVFMMENDIVDHSSLPYAENLSFGIENIRDAVIDLLIDEGVSNRGHRRNLLRKNISLIAVHELPGKVDGFSYCYIQEFK